MGFLTVPRPRAGVYLLPPGRGERPDDSPRLPVCVTRASLSRQKCLLLRSAAVLYDPGFEWNFPNNSRPSRLPNDSFRL